MKYLPIIAFQLLPIVSLCAKTHSFGGEADSSLYSRNLYSGKTSLVKSVKSTAFERYQWDASVDASFVLPSFYQVYANGYYGNTAYGYGSGGYGYYGNYGNSGVFTNSRSTRFMLRKNESVVNATNIPIRKGAYRAQLYVGGGYNTIKDSVRFNPSSTDSYFLQKASTVALGMSLGYEWQQQIGRFQLFYGYDVFARYNSNNEHGVIRNFQGRSEATSFDYHSTSAGISPLAGVKYFVSSQFSLSLEAAYSISYYWGEGSFTGPIYGLYERTYQEHGISYGLTPVSAINATFHFGQPNP